MAAKFGRIRKSRAWPAPTPGLLANLGLYRDNPGLGHSPAGLFQKRSLIFWSN